MCKTKIKLSVFTHSRSAHHHPGGRAPYSSHLKCNAKVVVNVAAVGLEFKCSCYQDRCNHVHRHQCSAAINWGSYQFRCTPWIGLQLHLYPDFPFTITFSSRTLGLFTKFLMFSTLAFSTEIFGLTPLEKSPGLSLITFEVIHPPWLWGLPSKFCCRTYAGLSCKISDTFHTCVRMHPVWNILWHDTWGRSAWFVCGHSYTCGRNGPLFTPAVIKVI